MKTCFTVPKLSYFLRTTPTWRIGNEIAKIDNIIIEALVSILNIQLNENQWTQASLPVRFGGLGTRKVTDISLPAFLASTHCVKDLLSTITDIKDCNSEIPYLDEGMRIWSGLGLPFPMDPMKQKSWDTINIERISGELQFQSEIEKFRFD